MGKSKRDPNEWIRELSREEFVNGIREVFDFLCREFTFSQPRIEQSPLTLILSYRAKRIAIEVVVDFRDLAVEVALVRLRNGERPEGWKIDKQGQQFMLRLYEARWARRVPSAKIAIPSDASPQTTLRLWLESEMVYLRHHFPDLLGDSDVFFDELNRAQKEHDEEQGYADASVQAGEAFHLKNYAEVVRLLTPFLYRLTPVQKKTLEYAARHV